MLARLVTETEGDTDLLGRSLTDPGSALKHALDIEIPAGISVVVHEGDTCTTYLVLPTS